MVYRDEPLQTGSPGTSPIGAEYRREGKSKESSFRLNTGLSRERPKGPGDDPAIPLDDPRVGPAEACIARPSGDKRAPGVKGLVELFAACLGLYAPRWFHLSTLADCIFMPNDVF